MTTNNARFDAAEELEHCETFVVCTIDKYSKTTHISMGDMTWEQFMQIFKSIDESFAMFVKARKKGKEDGDMDGSIRSVERPDTNQFPPDSV